MCACVWAVPCACVRVYEWFLPDPYTHTPTQLSVVRRLEGPSLVYFKHPRPQLVSAPPTHHLTYIGAYEHFAKSTTFPYLFELQPPVCMGAAQLPLLSQCLLGTAPGTAPPPSDALALQHGASLHALLATCNPDGSLEAASCLNPTSLPSLPSSTSSPGPEPEPSRASILVCLPGAAPQRYCLDIRPADSPSHQRGMLVQQLPIRDLNRVKHVLPLLRRHLTFSTLYQSCLGPPSCLPPASAEAAAEPCLDFVLSASAPNSITVDSSSLCNYRLVVMVPQQDPCLPTLVWLPLGAVADAPVPCALDGATRVLRACLSIPVTVQYLLTQLASSVTA